MASRFLTSRLRSHLSPLLHSAKLHVQPLNPNPHRSSPFILRHLSSVARRQPGRPRPVDIGARARQLQNRRLWTYALTFSCVAGFIVIVLANFQDQLVFYITPTDAMQKYKENPSRVKFRLGGLVLEGSVVHPSSTSPEMEFVITDLVTDILVRYEKEPSLFFVKLVKSLYLMNLSH